MPAVLYHTGNMDRRYGIRRVTEIGMITGKLIVAVIEMHTQQQEIGQGQYQITDAEEAFVSSGEHFSLNALVTK